MATPVPSFKKILVANRGEIALRILRTCKHLGFATVAVYSDADEGSPHARFADEAFRLGPPPAAESYLDPNRILAAAWATGAEAIHPGYGFLAENEDFADACVSAGLVFIGPPPEAIRRMGSKIESRKLMQQSGVPVTPGYNGEDQSNATLREKALELGFPVLVKASAGGGGKGMVVVRSEPEIAPALDQARRLAASSFGDDTLLLERYISPIRHVEIQILGDQHGTLLHIFERECSIQRRHQKIIEETPSVAVTPEIREAMGAAAVAAGRAVGYYSAGTVEFLLDPRGHFYFLEMNTRLQVEHPVTEMVTGLDLVEQQIYVALGRPLAFEQRDLRQAGHAIECRLYAEDPETDFLPCTGKILDWHVPHVAGLRVDAGVETGSDVGIFYDPMLAKIITHAATRPEAIHRMVHSLRRLAAQGVKTNRDFLIRLLEHPEFLVGNLSTHFISEHLPVNARLSGATTETVHLSCIAAMLASRHATGRERGGAHRQDACATEWAAGGKGFRPVHSLPGVLPGWRNSPFRDAFVDYHVHGSEVRVEYRRTASDRFTVRVDGGVELDVHGLDRTRPTLRFAVDGVQREFRVATSGHSIFVHSDLGELHLRELPRFPEAGGSGADQGCVAPMPGKIRRVLVKAGQLVTKGEPLVVLEAMKMEQTVTAPTDGTVAELLVAEGDQVEAQTLLVRFLPDKASESPMGVSA